MDGSMVSEYTIPPVPRIPKLLVRSSSDRCFTPVSSLSLPSETTYDNLIKPYSGTTAGYSSTKKRRPAPSVRSSSKGSVKSSRSQGSSLRISGSASDIPHKRSRPQLHTSSSYDIKTLQFLRFEADRSSEGMKEAGLLKNLMLKEPSSMALNEFAESEKQRAAAAAKRKQRAGLSSVSSRQLPASVPKVNSKWDGMPGSDAKRTAEGSIRSSAASIRTVTSMQKSTASSIRTSRSQRDIGTRFTETLSKFPACPQGVPDFLCVQSVGSPTKSSCGYSIGTSVTTASLPLSVEDDIKLRCPVEKLDLSETDQILDEDVVTSPPKPSNPIPLAQVNIPKEKFGPDMVEKGQLTRILVRDSDGSADEAVASKRSSRNRAATVGVTDGLDERSPTKAMLTLPHTSEIGAEVIPLGLRGAVKGAEEPTKEPVKSSNRKFLSKLWRKAFRWKFCAQ